jgi:environmental stress-induced protein Ves
MTVVVRAQDIAPTPWKNGGGLARDLLCSPSAADWRWRISLADVNADGPFSRYPGVQRWFAVVEGAGVELDFGGRAVHVRAGDVPLAFDGAAAPGCRLIAGPTRDLNLMLRGVRGTLLRVDPGQPWSEPWARRGRFDFGTLTLRWDLPTGPAISATPGLWIGIDEP